MRCWACTMTQQVELVAAAPSEEPILANLLELYGHDFSEFHPVELGPEGRFGYPRLALYWSEPQRHPFLVRVDGRLAGFALVVSGSVCDMAEFFIVRRYRRRGIGVEVAKQVWRQFPGPWEVRVMESNRAGREFWERAIAQFVAVPVPPVRVERNGVDWMVFSFESV